MAQGFALLEEELLFEEEILEAALLVEYWLVGHVCCYCCGTQGCQILRAGISQMYSIIHFKLSSSPKEAKKEPDFAKEAKLKYREPNTFKSSQI